MLESINKFVPVVTVPVEVGAEARIFNNADGLVIPIPTLPLAFNVKTVLVLNKSFIKKEPLACPASIPQEANDDS